jgi:hypothetical protein
LNHTFEAEEITNFLKKNNYKKQQHISKGKWQQFSSTVFVHNYLLLPLEESDKLVSPQGLPVPLLVGFYTNLLQLLNRISQC